MNSNVISAIESLEYGYNNKFLFYKNTANKRDETDLKARRIAKYYDYEFILKEQKQSTGSLHAMFIPNENNKIRNSLHFLLGSSPQKIGFFFYNLKENFKKLLKDPNDINTTTAFELHGDDVQHLHINVKVNTQILTKHPNSGYGTEGGAYEDRRSYVTFKTLTEDTKNHSGFLQNAINHLKGTGGIKKKITDNLLHIECEKHIIENHQKSLQALDDLNKLHKVFNNDKLKMIAKKLTDTDILNIFSTANQYNGYTRKLSGYNQQGISENERDKRMFSVEFQKLCASERLFTTNQNAKDSKIGLRTKRMFEKFDKNDAQDAVQEFIRSVRSL